MAAELFRGDFQGTNTYQVWYVLVFFFEKNLVGKPGIERMYNSQHNISFLQHF